MDILTWWNLIFILPFALGVLYVLLLASGLSIGDHDTDADGLDDGGADLDGDHDLGVAGSILGAIGVGRVPLPIILTSLALTWGFTGWASNLLLSRTPAVEGYFPLLSIAAATLAAFGFTGVATRVMARILPSTQSYGARNHDFVGQLAVARLTITDTFGRAFLYDTNGTPQEVTCRVQTGETPIAGGARVLLYDYDRDRDMFLVCPDPTHDTGENAGEPLRREP